METRTRTLHARPLTLSTTADRWVYSTNVLFRRKKFERSTPVFSYPLPWTPGWRNLLRGRPLGTPELIILKKCRLYPTSGKTNIKIPRPLGYETSALVTFLGSLG